GRGRRGRGGRGGGAGGGGWGGGGAAVGWAGTGPASPAGPPRPPPGVTHPPARSNVGRTSRTSMFWSGGTAGLPRHASRRPWRAATDREHELGRQWRRPCRGTGFCSLVIVSGRCGLGQVFRGGATGAACASFRALRM